MSSSPLREPGVRENLYGLGFREVSPGSGSKYLPLELIPARDYAEDFRITGVGNGLNLSVMWSQVLFYDNRDKHFLTKHFVPSGSTLTVELSGAETARLYATLGRGREIGEWRMFPGPMATGPVSFKQPPTGKLPMWWCISPFGPPIREYVITLNGNDRGEWSDTAQYGVGDIVQYGGRYWYSLCEDPSVPVWSGEDANALPGDFDPNADPAALAAETGE